MGPQTQKVREPYYQRRFNSKTERLNKMRKNLEKRKQNKQITKLFLIFSSASGVLIGGKFPVWALALCGGILLALIVAMTTKSDRRPRAHFVSVFNPSLKQCLLL